MPKKVEDRMLMFNCYLTGAQLTELERVAEEERRPKAELVREAVAQYLASRKGGQRSSKSSKSSQ